MEKLRLRRWLVRPEFLIEAAREGFSTHVEVAENPLPADARFYRATFDYLTLCVNIFVESDSFDPVEEGAVPPEHGPTTWRKLA